MKIINLEGVIGPEATAADIRKELPKGSERVRLDINSPGGDVFEAFAIYNALKDYPGKVTARVCGLAASAAADIFFGADEREMYTHSAVMYHRARTFAYGNAEELRSEADILNSLDEIRIKDFERITGKTRDEAMAEFTNETWLIGSGKVLEKGISVRVVDSEEGGIPVTEPEARKRVAEAKKTLTGIRKKENQRGAALQKIAALAREKKDAPAQAVADNSQVEGDEKMDLKAFLEKNPGAESEILALAKTKIGPVVEEAVKAESDRIQGILALAGVRFSDDVKQALSGGITPEKYAVNALTKQRETEASLKEGNGLRPGYVAQTPGEQTKGAADKINAVTEASLKALIGELRGGL